MANILPCHILPCLNGHNQFQLPEVNSEKGTQGQGWRIATEVRASAIPDSGSNGRFAKVAAKKGDVVLVKVSVPMKNVKDLKTLPLDTMLVFEGTAEIGKYVRLATAEGFTATQIQTTIMHFMHGFSDKQCLLNVCAYIVNHKDEKMGGLNLEINEKVEDGKSTWVCTAKEDVKPGDELMIDYRRFKTAKFYKEYARKNGYEDVRTAVVECVYGKGNTGYEPCLNGHNLGSFQLPDVNSETGVQGQGWRIATEVRASAIPDCGNGRFAKVAAKKGDVVLVKVSVPMKNVEDLKTLPLDTMLVFEGTAEIDKYVKLATAEGFTATRIQTTIMHFMHGFSDKQCLLNVCCYTVNHKDEKMGGLNLEINEKVEDGKSTWVCIAKEDVKPGDELVIDYRRFKTAKFYEEYARKNGYEDVRTAVVECVYGKGKTGYETSTSAFFTGQ